MSNLSENPESTWGMTPAQKEAWVRQYAEKSESVEEPTAVELDASNPESTWGKPVEEKLEFFERNVDGYDPEKHTGGPTEVGLHDESLFKDRPETQNTLDAGPAAYSGDDRDPEYQPIYVPDGSQDYTPPPGEEPRPPRVDNNQPAPPPVDEESTTGTSQPGPTPEESEQPQPPVDMPTLDGQENTANESSTTGGADVSQTTTTEAPAEFTPLYEEETNSSPVTESNDSAANTPGAEAAEVREAASNRGRAKRSAGRDEGTGVREDLSVEKRES